MRKHKGLKHSGFQAESVHTCLNLKSQMCNYNLLLRIIDIIDTIDHYPVTIPGSAPPIWRGVQGGASEVSLEPNTS